MRLDISLILPTFHCWRGEIRSEESQVIFDSSYFKNIDGVEAGIEKDSRLQDIDLRVKEEYLETLTKFYQVIMVNPRTCIYCNEVFSVSSQYKGTGRTLSS